MRNDYESRLKPYYDKLQPSKPIFTVEQGWGRIQFSNVPEAKFDTESINDGTYEASLIINSHREYFSFRNKQFIINDSPQMFRSCYDTVLTDALKFVEKHSELKNPRQSKLWKSLLKNQRYGASDDFKSGLLLIMKYAHEQTHGTKIFIDKSSEHAKNIMILIEETLERYK